MRQLLPLLVLILLCTCDPAPENVYVGTDSVAPIHRLQGKAMGSYYRITYTGDSLPHLADRIDSLLTAYNLELSAWEPLSKLTAFNQTGDGVDLSGTDHFIANLEIARKVHEETDGAYDPTIAPLVNYWGFGTGTPRPTAEVNESEVAAMLPLIGLEKITVEGQFLRKALPDMQLDLNASAKGYGVDLISQLLTDSDRRDHLVDVGGEMRGGGTKYGRPWNVAIRLPDEDKTKVAQAGTLPLSDGRAIATSGNYLNYYKVDGETFSHTINPKTGLVERNRLLSVSVLAPDCATADAYATACMVVGPERALELVNARKDLEGYFLVRGKDGGLETLKSSGLPD